LLRYADFEPARGTRAILPYLDEMRHVRNLESLEGLCATLAKQ
jgi:uncharacterized protein with von Willebrand factor type A (vWA) domain